MATRSIMFKIDVKKLHLFGEVNSRTKYSIVNQVLKANSRRNQVSSLQTGSYEVSAKLAKSAFFSLIEGTVSAIETAIATTITLTENMAKHDAANDVSG